MGATDDEVLKAYKAFPTISGAAASLGISERRMHQRLTRIEARTGEKLRMRAGALFGTKVRINRDNRPNPVEIENGTIVVASDAHYWPGDPSTGHRALCKIVKQLKPEIVVMNGDELDGATISRHQRQAWEKRPTLTEEIRALKERMDELWQAAPRAKHLGSYGNHSLRYDTYLSGNAPAMEGVKGTTFDDLLPEWSYAWAWMVNGHTLIKHRIKGGIHATWLNTADAQVSTVTGHIHQLRVTPRSTMSPINGGRIYGVDSGMLADPWGPQFAYVEQGPRNWASGFAVLTFKDGMLLPPELVCVVGEDKAFFRGNVIDV